MADKGPARPTPARKIASAPKKTLRAVAEKPKTVKIFRPSDVRLKVRNIDDKQVSNEDLKVSLGLH